MRVEIFPLEKIQIDDKEIILGMNSEQVQELIGIPDRIFDNMAQNLIGIIILIANWDWILMKMVSSSSLSFSPETMVLLNHIFMGYRRLK